MTLKHYIVKDTAVLAQLEAWALDPARRASLYKEELSTETRYRVVVDDALGMTACSPAFESEFGSAVQQTEFPQ